MPRRISIKNHLSIGELITRYQQAKDPIERSRYQIIYLLLEEKPIKEVAELVKLSQQAIYNLVQRYNEAGPKALQNLRSKNVGRPEKALLDDKQQELLWVTLQSPPPNGERWNGVLVAQWMSKLLNRDVNRQIGLIYLKKMRKQMRKPVSK